mgnify:CR=1 FL=1
MSRRRPDEYDRSQYVYCYAWGHTWFPSDSDWNPLDVTDFIVLGCERCTTEWRDGYGTYTGELILRYYIYPEGYRYARGEDKPTKAEFRLMAVQMERDRRKEQLQRKRSKALALVK